MNEWSLKVKAHWQTKASSAIRSLLNNVLIDDINRNYPDQLSMAEYIT